MNFFYAFYEAINGLNAHYKSLMTYYKQVASMLNKQQE
jgi:archaellum component FlaC